MVIIVFWWCFGGGNDGVFGGVLVVAVAVAVAAAAAVVAPRGSMFRLFCIDSWVLYGLSDQGSSSVLYGILRLGCFLSLKTRIASSIITAVQFFLLGPFGHESIMIPMSQS